MSAVPGSGWCVAVQRCSDRVHDEGGGNDDVIAGDKLPFVPAPHPGSGTLTVASGL